MFAHSKLIVTSENLQPEHLEKACFGNVYLIYLSVTIDPSYFFLLLSLMDIAYIGYLCMRNKTVNQIRINNNSNHYEPNVSASGNNLKFIWIHSFQQYRIKLDLRYPY